MNRPNPFIPQGSFLADASKRRRKARFVVSASLAFLTILLFGLLIEGWRHSSRKTGGSILGLAKTPPSFVTNAPPTSTLTTAANRTLGAATALVDPTRIVIGSNTFYVVKSGDFLSKIARTHGTTVKALRAANSLKNDGIVVGQKLRLPPALASTVVPAPQEFSHE